METTKTVDVYINNVLALKNQMKTNGETHSEQAKAGNILRSLTLRFEHVVAAIQEANDISTMTVRLLSDSLRAHEQRMNDNKNEKPIEQALQAQTSIGSSYHKQGSSRGKGWGCGGSYSNKGRGGQNHGGAEQNNIGSNHNPNSNNSCRGGRGGMYKKSNVECYNCHKHDHYTNDCRLKGDNHVAICAQEDSNHKQDEEDHAVLMAAISNETPNNQTWYLDTGCTNHMCVQKELFVDFDDSFRTKVKFGDDRFVPVTGTGRILNTLKNDDYRYIYDVFYVPDMKSNLLSVGQLAEKGYVMHIVENKFSIFDKKGNLILRTFLSKNRMFPLDIHMGDFKCLNAIVNNES